MKTILSLTTGQTAQLAALNASAPKNHRVPLVRGGVPARLLQHCGHGQPYEHFADFLRSLAVETKPEQPITSASEPKPKRKR